MSDDPAQFYTGLVAEAYALLRSFAPDVDLCERVIRELGEPALELGCGDGDPLIELRRRGVDVEGLDSSGDMVERCRRRAGVEGVDVVVHQADMTAMSLGRRFQTIFLAGPTMNLLPDDATTTAALAAIYSHLEPGGRAFIPLFEPAPVADIADLEPKEHVGADGTRLRATVTKVERDETARVQTTTLRYERAHSSVDEIETVERPWLLHWHTQDGFRALAERAGLVAESITDYHGEPATPEATYIHVTLRRP
jgi:SAM-dependent methyltransferase